MKMKNLQHGEQLKKIVFGVRQSIFTIGGLMWFKSISVQKCDGVLLASYPIE